MSDLTSLTSLAYRGDTFLEVKHKGAVLFVDPVFSRTRRGRRTRETTQPCDYVLMSTMGESFEDTLDVLEDHERATLIGSMAVCREARRELRISRQRTFDLEDWESANDGDVRITAIPVAQPTPTTSGFAFMEEIGGAMQAEVARAFARLPVGGASPFGTRGMRGLRELARLPGAQLFGGAGVGETATGFRLELGSTVVALLGRGIHEGTDEAMLEDLVSLGPIHTVVVEAVSSVGAMVRAMRVLEPDHVLVYRGHDPYGRGRRSLAMRDADVPLSAYVEALAEDRGSAFDARVLRAGDSQALHAAPAAVAQEAARN